MSTPKDSHIAATKRKNRAQRKLTRLENIDPLFKLLAIAIVDKLNAGSQYRVAWPSVPTLSKIIGRSERTTLRYLQKVYASEFFVVHKLAPQDAIHFLKSNFEIDVDLQRCRKFSPNIYAINESHALWNSKEKLPATTIKQLQELAGSKL